MDAIGNFVARFNRSREEELSLDDYLLECKRNPLAYATAAERMLQAIGEPQVLDTRNDPRLSRIFANKLIKIYPAFSEFYGMEEVVEQVVSYFRHAAQGLEERKQILYLLGPVGGGKSSLAERLKHLMQQVPFYAIKGSPVNESPLGLFDAEEANPVHLMYVLEQQIEREQFPADLEHKYTAFIKELLAPRYAEFIGKEIQTAYLESYSEYGQNIFDRYVTYADYWIQDNECRDTDNYLFRMWTDAGSIIDYLVSARRYVAECEERHGMEAVETLLDSCHALANFGVDRYRRPSKKSLAVEQAERKEREAYAQQQVYALWSTLPQRADKGEDSPTPARFPAEPQENLLYFIEKNSPLLEPWQREIVRLVRKIAQYFYPQRQTQVMNEGWAVFWHYTLLNTLYDHGYLSDGVMLEWLGSHSKVLHQPPLRSRMYSGINPYALGFAMYRDIQRICQHPTEEDRRWFPDLAGKPWQETLDHAMRNYKDESFVGQFLSPRLMRDMRLFAIHDDENAIDLEVSAIHDDAGYTQLRQALSAQYDLGTRELNIQVWSVHLRGDRTLVLRHTPYHDRPLGDSTLEVLKHTARLWGFGVRLESVNAAGEVTRQWNVAAPA